MLLLFSRDGRLPMGKASARLQVHPTSVTNAVDRLAAAGLVRREPHPTDGRATLVALTDEGRDPRCGRPTCSTRRCSARPGLGPDRVRALVDVLDGPAPGRGRLLGLSPRSDPAPVPATRVDTGTDRRVGGRAADGPGTWCPRHASTRAPIAGSGSRRRRAPSRRRPPPRTPRRCAVRVRYGGRVGTYPDIPGCPCAPGAPVGCPGAGSGRPTPRGSDRLPRGPSRAHSAPDRLRPAPPAGGGRRPRGGRRPARRARGRRGPQGARSRCPPPSRATAPSSRRPPARRPPVRARSAARPAAQDLPGHPQPRHRPGLRRRRLQRAQGGARLRLGRARRPAVARRPRRTRSSPGWSRPTSTATRRRTPAGSASCT